MGAETGWGPKVVSAYKRWRKPQAAQGGLVAPCCMHDLGLTCFRFRGERCGRGVGGST